MPRRRYPRVVRHRPVDDLTLQDLAAYLVILGGPYAAMLAAYLIFRGGS